MLWASRFSRIFIRCTAVINCCYAQTNFYFIFSTCVTNAFCSVLLFSSVCANSVTYCAYTKEDVKSRETVCMMTTNNYNASIRANITTKKQWRMRKCELVLNGFTKHIHTHTHTQSAQLTIFIHTGKQPRARTSTQYSVSKMRIMWSKTLHWFVHFFFVCTEKVFVGCWTAVLRSIQ